MESAELEISDIATKEAELAELKCKMIFRTLCKRDFPMNHETEIIYI